MKAIGGLLPIVRANMASITVIEGRGDEVDVPIEKIDALAPYGKPCTTIDPCSPPSQVSYGRIGIIIEDGDNGMHMDTIQGLVFTVVEANIDIGVRSRPTTRVGASQGDGFEAMKRFQMVNQLLQQ